MLPFSVAKFDAMNDADFYVVIWLVVTALLVIASTKAPKLAFAIAVAILLATFTRVVLRKDINA